MHYFNDTNGKQWEIQINLITLKRVKAATGCNLLEVLEIDKGTEGLLYTLANDPIILSDVLSIICLKDSDNQEQFLKNMNGDTMEAASMALLEEIADFFPKAKGALLKKVIQAARAQEQMAQKEIERLINTEEFNQGLTNFLNNSTQSPTNSLELSESTQKPTPSEI